MLPALPPQVCWAACDSLLIININLLAFDIYYNMSSVNLCAGATRSTSSTPKSSTSTSRPSSAKKIPVMSATPAKGEKELEAQVTQLNEQVDIPNAINAIQIFK